MQAQVGGKLAQIGARLIDGVAAKMAEDFFAKFNQIVAAPQDQAAASASQTAGEQAPPPAAAQPASPAVGSVTGGIPSWLWIAGLIVIVCAATVLVLRG